ncbi:MAG: HEPN domain-containing protein [Bacteroidales bacterium]|nr:HEPN domain-containing protein [Bacteroidales bacterium]MCF8334256.1 HEPN domain-containing protein [Bacteroidales bacterium]
MNREERDEYVKYRLDSAYKALDAAKVLVDNGFWSSAVNRLYYSLFYALNALLVANKIETKIHTGLKSHFSKYFVKTGEFDKKYGKLFSKLFAWRQRADYSIVSDFDKDTVMPLFSEVKEMLDIISNQINDKNN